MSKITLNISIILLSIVFLSSCGGDEKTIGLKENIHHDDFEYSVQSVQKLDAIGTVKAKDKFYLVNFQVSNLAKRVEHKWSNSIAYIVDASGKEYENMPELQKNLKKTMDFNLKDNYVTPAGKNESTVLVFEIPQSAGDVFLKVRGQFLMGDMFDGNQFEKTKIKLN